MQQTQIPAARGGGSLETIDQFADTNARANLYPATRWAVRGLFRYREAHGISAAFVAVGRRWLVDRQRFYELLIGDKQSPVKQPTRVSQRRKQKGARA
jgi:hypothetical protein